MYFTLTEDQALIQASALDWLATCYDFHARQAGVHREGGNAQAWAAWAQLGWLALPLPEALGGIGGGPVETGLLAQALGRHLAVEPFHGCILQAARLLALAGSAAQRAHWLPAVAQGRLRLAFAHAEAGEASPWSARRSTVHRVGDNAWVLEGDKLAVEGAAGAAAWLVTAREARTGRACVLIVDPAAPGVSQDAYDTLDGGRAADLRFDAVRLAPHDWLGGVMSEGEDAGEGVGAGEGEGAPEGAGARALPGQLWRVVSEGVVARCWQAAGAMQATLEQTIRHTQDRRQFGQALAQFQVVQHRIAEMAVHCAEAQAACELAAMALAREPSQGGPHSGGLDSGEPAAAMARSKVCAAARFVAQQAVQLHGAMGVCEELPIASAFRALLAFEHRDGDPDALACRLGAHLLAQGAHARSRTLGAAA